MRINLVRDLDDRDRFEAWFGRQHTVAVDCETSGLEIYSPEFKLRLVQFANPQEAWVVPYHHLFANAWKYFMSSHKLIMHNASFDIQVLVQTLGVEAKHLWERTTDTRVLAHLVDPRGREEGGTGHGLDELASHYLGENKTGDQLKEEFLRLRKEGEIPEGAPLSERFALMPLYNPVFVRYAGIDAILTARLYTVLEHLSRPYNKLVKFEHKVAMIASLMDAQGFLLDTKYTEALSVKLGMAAIRHKATAQALGLNNINSVQQIADWLAERNVVSPKTAKGNPSIDGKFLEELLEDEGPLPTDIGIVARAIIEGKKAGKWRKTWVEKFLMMADSQERVHPSTNTLRARTARFSVTGIPTQTLPATDSLVRTCFVADAGERVVAVDYANQELRFLAAKSGDSRMIRAFKKNDDLHLITAEAAFPGRGLEMRKYGKLTNFATVYGVGAGGLATQTGLPIAECRTLLRAFRSSYPGVAAFGERLGETARREGHIVTATSRRLPVDVDRSYAALNYYVQSGCRDVTAQALVDLYDAGYLKYMRLAIHDEVVLSLPEDDEDIVRDIERIMSTRVGAVELPAGAKIGGKSWGSLYQTNGT